MTFVAVRVLQRIDEYDRAVQDQTCFRVLAGRQLIHHGQCCFHAGRFTTVIKATIKGNLVVALVQGALGSLIFWILEITAGPADGPWSVALRLHHRSTGWGLMGTDDGGMNAPGLGFRYEF